jgi:hypothetical protein
MQTAQALKGEKTDLKSHSPAKGIFRDVHKSTHYAKRFELMW